MRAHQQTRRDLPNDGAILVEQITDRETTALSPEFTVQFPDTPKDPVVALRAAQAGFDWAQLDRALPVNPEELVAAREAVAYAPRTLLPAWDELTVANVSIPTAEPTAEFAGRVHRVLDGFDQVIDSRGQDGPEKHVPSVTGLGTEMDRELGSDGIDRG